MNMFSSSVGDTIKTGKAEEGMAGNQSPLQQVAPVPRQF